MTVQASNSYALIEQAVQEQRCVVLDGGVATELPHRHSQGDERLWGIEAVASAPAVVLDVHRRYVDAGVDVVTTNTWGLPTALSGTAEITDEHGRPMHWMESARRGVRVARQAIADAGREGRCAVAFSLNGDLDGPEGGETVSLLQRALGNDAPDLIVLETLSVLRPSLFAVVERLLATEIPVWLSFRRCRHGLCGVYGQHWGGPEGDAFGRAARRFEELGVAALLVNCIPPDHVAGMVSYLRDFTDMTLGVYPNLGYFTDAGWRFETEIGGAEYAELALRWRAEGAQIVGGCCGTRPEHIAAARAALAGTRPGTQRHEEPEHRDADGGTAVDRPPRRAWTDQLRRPLHPLPFPAIAEHPGVTSAIPGTQLMWRHLLEQRVGSHQRCLDIGSGAGLQAVQLALNGAGHVHAIDIDERAVANTLDNAFRNGVAELVSGETADVYPWIPDERYEVVVANLPQIPVAPAAQLSSHRPTDYWGRGLVDQVIAKLPLALAAEGIALLTLTSLLSQERTSELLGALGLHEEVVAWEVQPLPASYRARADHLANVEQLSDAYRLHVGGDELLVTYLLEIRHREPRRDGRRRSAPWATDA
jgi:S-methylmethionine-dependent homocysteine/selenocysteine methylase/SAM-dependent methyltransferase